MSRNTVEIALQLKRLMIRGSPLLEEYTTRTCPGCADVCCRQKHGLFRERDTIFLTALGIGVPPHDGTRPPEGPCEFLGNEGCGRPRWLRPFRCTWYFCDPLLRAMNDGPRKKARALSALLQEMIGLYDALKG